MERRILPHEPSSNENQGTLQLSEDDPEVKKGISLANNVEEPFPNLLSRLEYFSDLYRAKRAIALCLYYIQLLKGKVSRNIPSNAAKSLEQVTPVSSGSQVITVAAMEQAEVQIIKAVQTSNFQKELKALSSVQKLEDPKSKPGDLQMKYALNSCSSLFKLDPFLDPSGILRVGGRLKWSSMSDNIKLPVVLPKKCHITDLVINHCHNQAKHQGRGMTVNEIRSRGFWIIG